MYDAYSLKELSPHSDSCASTRYFVVAKRRHTLNLSKHHALSLLSLLWGLLYSYYIIYWHEVYVEMAVEAISRKGLDGFNNSVMKTVLGLCGLGIVIITWAIWRQFQFNRRPRTILLGLICFALLVAVWFITHTVFF